MLSGMYASVEKKGLVSSMVEVRAVQALAATAPGEALGFLADALKMAQPEGFIRTFVDRGEPMQALLERLKAQGGDLKPYILALLDAFGEVSQAPKAQSLVEPLSERELDVLQLLSEGLSNGEIAQRLVVSVGTIKTHVHRIIDKLGVRSRTQAVTQARQLNLL